MWVIFQENSSFFQCPWNVLYQSGRAADWSHYSCCSEQRGARFLNAVFGQRSYFVTCVRSGQSGKSDRKLERLWESFRGNRKKDAFTIQMQRFVLHRHVEWSRYYQLMFTVITHECNISSVVNKDKLVTLYTVIIVSSLLAIAFTC